MPEGQGKEKTGAPETKEQPGEELKTFALTMKAKTIRERKQATAKAMLERLKIRRNHKQLNRFWGVVTQFNWGNEKDGDRMEKHLGRQVVGWFHHQQYNHNINELKMVFFAWYSYMSKVGHSWGIHASPKSRCFVSMIQRPSK
jgi:hypothetical protein